MPTIKEHCCGTDLFFDKKTAEKQYKKYLKKGPTKVTARIIEQLQVLDVKGKSLIDVGGGIGALQWWFLENGGSNTIDIDASSGYVNKAKKHAQENNWLTKTEFLVGDCTALFPEIDYGTFITLDKVICCYPEYKDILIAAFNKKPQYISLSYPMDGIISELVRALGALALKLTNNKYRPFVHSVKDVRQLFIDNGYTRINKSLSFPWHIETYSKTN